VHEGNNNNNNDNINRNDRIVATMCSLGTWFVSGMYVEITCIKETMMMIIIITATAL
jgi:hypothetical protein